MDLNELTKNYRKYKWFFTSTGKLVIGGKSAEQNEELLYYIKNIDRDFIVMHTSHPGSPFSIIMDDIKKIKQEDIDECAIFTGCFSRAWKQGRKKTEVHIFKASQLYKKKDMKKGTWGVTGIIKKINVELKLALTTQKGVLRAIPESSLKNKKDILLKICPGKTPKEILTPKLQIELNRHYPYNELLSALPAGGIRICK